MKRVYKKKTKEFPAIIPDSIKTATYLIIVESPSKCKKIESFLGPGYSCIASKGHLRTIHNLKSIDIKNNYQITFDMIDEKKSHIEWMKRVIGHFKKENIIIATDDDREGEAIAWHLCDLFSLPIEKTQRILFHEITQAAIRDAIKTPTTVNMKLVHAGFCRQVLDLFIGFKISPILWKYLYRNKDNSLSAGRCQSPALRLVYDNAEEKKKESLNKAWKITGFFTSRGIECALSRDFEKEENVLQFLERSKEFCHKGSIGSATLSIRDPPKPFHTSGLLQAASSNLHMSPKETMSLCQQLYQEGHITYMRTESQVYSETFLLSASDYISGSFSKESIGNLEKISNKVSGDPHEAIRVTHIEVGKIDGDNRRLCSLYRLIWENTIESCMAPAKYDVIKISISAPDDLHYKHTVEIPLELGWKLVSHRGTLVEAQTEGRGMIFFMTALLDSPIPFSLIQTAISISGRHSHYTEASLIKKLEDLGIGRPSTFASIVETNIERGYFKKTDIEGSLISCNEHSLEAVKSNKKGAKGENSFIIKTEKKERMIGSEKNKLVIQPIGILTIEFLVDMFSNLFSYDYTKRLESELDCIAEGTLDKWQSICETCISEIDAKIKAVNTIGKRAYPIETGEYELVFEKYGPVLRTGTKEKYTFHSVKKDISIDLGKLQRGEYSLADLREEMVVEFGEHEGSSLIVRVGPYGNYIDWNSQKINIRSLEKGIGEIQKEDLLPFLSSFSDSTFKKDIPNENKNILRIITPDLSIRKGKFGAYIYYKTDSMSKPAFYNIQKFKESYHHCSPEVLVEWLNKTYNTSFSI
jgi:DNA topoisomerase I